MFRKNKNYIIIIFLLLIIIFGIVYYVYNREEKVYTSANDFTSVKEVVNYMECKYISQGQSTASEYPLSISLVFKHLPYENSTSYEKFYNEIINLVAKVVNYENFRLEDSENSIYVSVKCNADTEAVTEVLINGSSTYFSDSKNNQNISNYIKVNNIDVNVESKVLKNLIANSWKTTSINFGTKDSTFSDYDIYFDEGIEVRNISNKVFNIVFTKKYKENILNGIKVGNDLSTVKEILGEPNIINATDGNFYGYKTDKFYIFFLNNEVSIYRIETYDTKEFASIVDTFISERNSKNLVNSLINLWDDYDYYYYDENVIVLRYSLRGIEVQFNLSSEHGISLYNEFNGSITSSITLDSVLSKEEDLPKYVYLKNSNLVYTSEVERQGLEYTEEIADRLSDIFMAVVKERTSNGYYLSIISKTNEYPNSELGKEVNSNIWIDNNRLAYSIRNKGIYIYNAATRMTEKIIEGSDEFAIKSYESNVLKYDNKSINIK